MRISDRAENVLQLSHLLWTVVCNNNTFDATQPVDRASLCSLAEAMFPLKNLILHILRDAVLDNSFSCLVTPFGYKDGDECADPILNGDLLHVIRRVRDAKSWVFCGKHVFWMGQYTELLYSAMIGGARNLAKCLYRDVLQHSGRWCGYRNYQVLSRLAYMRDWKEIELNYLEILELKYLETHQDRRIEKMCQTMRISTLLQWTCKNLAMFTNIVSHLPDDVLNLVIKYRNYQLIKNMIKHAAVESIRILAARFDFRKQINLEQDDMDDMLRASPLCNIAEVLDYCDNDSTVWDGKVMAFIMVDVAHMQDHTYCNRPYDDKMDILRLFIEKFNVTAEMYYDGDDDPDLVVEAQAIYCNMVAHYPQDGVELMKRWF